MIVRSKRKQVASAGGVFANTFYVLVLILAEGLSQKVPSVPGKDTPWPAQPFLSSPDTLSE